MKRGNRTFTCAAVALAAFAPAAWADEFAYATDTTGTLYSVNLTTGGATTIGSHGVFLESLALSPGGELFGADGGGDIYSLDTTTAFATFVGSTGLGNIEGMDFNGSDMLATDFGGTPNVYSIDTSNGTPTLVSTFDAETGAVRTMAVKDADTIMARCDLPGPNSLYGVTYPGGVTTFVGNMGGSIMAAMDYGNDGVLYALDGDGSVYTINDSTGEATLTGDTGDQFWLGMASNPVPEPATLWALGAGIALLAGRSRRKR
ncbi:MAG: PEP-CTERM sorting domain-containing protein [Armatimonadetes bacterium]|nr:PEP-CTERM sorting domain-containing protein [Armatimonadota bacterium]